MTKHKIHGQLESLEDREISPAPKQGIQFNQFGRILSTYAMMVFSVVQARMKLKEGIAKLAWIW